LPAELSRLRSPAAVQAALDEFARLGRTAFLERYGFGKSRDYLVRDPTTGMLCDSKAVIGAAYGYQFPGEGPLSPAAFSGGEATVVARLKALGFAVLRIGEDWSADEVAATVASYFAMLLAEAKQEPYNKTEHNAQLRQSLRGRSKAAVELKHQNISAVLNSMEMPFISGYKPRSNVQLLLRQSVQRYALDHPDLMRRIVDAMEEVRVPAQQQFQARVVDPPPVESVAMAETSEQRLRVPRKVDYALRDQANRNLGRSGEQWVLEFEHRRLIEAGLAELFARVEWVSERLGDGMGYDILSLESADKPRYIEVKTTNGAHATSFIVSRNELDFSQEAGDEFHLYRVFQFRQTPMLYILSGDITRHVHLEPIDYRASFRRLVT
jgi:hypothetical protein